MLMGSPYRTFPHVNKLVRRSYKSVAGIIFFSLIGSLLESLGIGLIIPLVASFGVADGAEVPRPLAELYALGGNQPASVRVAMLLAGIVLAIALKNIASVMAYRLTARTEGDVGHAIRTALAERVLTIGYPFFLTERPAHLVHVIATESWRSSDSVRAVLNGLSAAVSALVMLAILVLLDWRLFIALALGIICIGVVEKRLLRSTRELSRKVSKVNDRLADRMMVAVQAMRPIRVFGQEQFELNRFAQSSAHVRDSILDLERHSGRVPAILDMLHIGLLVAIILITTGFGVGIAIPSLVTFLVLLQRTQPHLRTMEHARSQFAACYGAIAEVEWLLDPEGKPAPPQGSLPFHGFHKSVSFEDVTYYYPARGSDHPALSRATFTLQAGRMTALVGQSGAGKSTIVALLCRLIEPDRGRISVDGADLADMNVADWRRKIGLAGQDIDLIEGTISENISYGLADATPEQILEAAEIADLSPLLEQLPHGVQTNVGSRGLELSGGQRQKIGLARALIRQPDLLILDEATSAMDGEAEGRVLANLHALARTVLIISHRESALRQCDAQIHVVNGKVSQGEREVLRERG